MNRINLLCQWSLIQNRHNGRFFGNIYRNNHGANFWFSGLNNDFIAESPDATKQWLTTVNDGVVTNFRLELIYD